MAPNERSEDLCCSKQILTNTKSQLVFFVNGEKEKNDLITSHGIQDVKLNVEKKKTFE